MLISKDTPLSEILRLGAPCNRCGKCCEHGSGFVLEHEAKEIAKYLGITEEELIKNYLEETELFNKRVFKLKRIKRENKKTSEIPHGKCVFYDEEKGCLIHSVKPLFCKIVNCKPYSSEIIQWYFLNFILDTEDPEAVRQWATYLKYNEPIVGANLSELIPKDKLDKIMNFELISKVQVEAEKLKEELNSLITRSQPSIIFDKNQNGGAK